MPRRAALLPSSRPPRGGVFRPAVLQSAASIIVARSHPSGDPEPSEEDVSITRRLAQVAELLGIAVLDHVIVAKRGTARLRERESSDARTREGGGRPFPRPDVPRHLAQGGCHVRIARSRSSACHCVVGPAP